MKLEELEKDISAPASFQTSLSTKVSKMTKNIDINYDLKLQNLQHELDFEKVSRKKSEALLRKSEEEKREIQRKSEEEMEEMCNRFKKEKREIQRKSEEEKRKSEEEMEEMCNRFKSQISKLEKRIFELQQESNIFSMKK